MTQSQIENETIERLARLAEDPDGPDFIMGSLSKREVAEWLRTQKSEELLTQKSESVRELEQAREWIAANQPEPSVCIYCGHGMTNCSTPGAMAWNGCPMSPTKNHTYNFVTDPDWEAKRLAAYAKSVTLKLAEEAEEKFTDAKEPHPIDGRCCPETYRQGRNEIVAEFAAWLREKAR